MLLCRTLYTLYILTAPLSLYLLLLRAPTTINDKNGTRNQCQATTHQQSGFTQQLCTSKTPTATGLSQVATTLLTWEVTMSEKMAANSARTAAGGLDCEAVQFASHWRSRYACTAERESESSVPFSHGRKDRPVTLGPYSKRWKIRKGPHNITF